MIAPREAVWRAIPLAILCLAIASWSRPTAGDPLDQPASAVDVDKERARDWLNKVLLALNPLWQEDLRIPVATHVIAFDDSRPGDPRIEVRDVSQRISIGFHPETGRVKFVYHRELVGRALNAARATPGISPTLDKQAALHRAQEILRALYGEVPSDIQLQPHRPAFGSSDTDPGTWWVEWAQTVGGFPCERGQIVLRFHEQLGLYSFSDGLRPDHCPLEVRVDREEAVKKARAVGEEAARRYSTIVYGSGVGPLLDRPWSLAAKMAKDGLVIVNPNWMYGKDGRWPKDPNNDPMVDVYNSARRLAYVVEFALIDPGPPDEVDRKVIGVYVDAADGTILGGYFTNR